MSDTTTPTPEKAKKQLPKLTPAQRKKARSIEIELNFPILRDGKEHEHITVRRLTAQDRVDISEMDCSDSMKGIRLMAKATGLDPEEVLSLDGSDYDQIEEVIQDFFSLRPGN